MSDLVGYMRSDALMFCINVYNPNQHKLFLSPYLAVSGIEVSLSLSIRYISLTPTGAGPAHNGAVLFVVQPCAAFERRRPLPDLIDRCLRVQIVLERFLHDHFLVSLEYIVCSSSTNTPHFVHHHVDRSDTAITIALDRSSCSSPSFVWHGRFPYTPFFHQQHTQTHSNTQTLKFVTLQPKYSAAKHRSCW